MKSALLLVVFTVFAAMLFGCAGINNSTYRSGSERGNYGGHSHH